MPRGLNKEFLDDLQSGLLAPILHRVRGDHTLILEIRENYLNLYYRGGSATKLEQIDRHVYRATFDPQYFAPELTAPASFSTTQPIKSVQESEQWVARLPEIKNAMDLWLGKYGHAEREAQQLLVRENNYGDIGRQSDYYICDIEYATPGRGYRFDAVAARWLSKPNERKRVSGLELKLIEMKFGHGALAGTAGLSKHLDDAEKLASSKSELAAVRCEMVAVFQQKHALGLISSTYAVQDFADVPLKLVFVLVNQDPDKTGLKKILAQLKPVNVDVEIAAANLFGYSLFDGRIEPLANFLSTP